MMTIEPFGLLSDVEAVQLPVPELTPERSSNRRLRHYIVGDAVDVQNEIDRLHLLGYAERILWSRVIQVPSGGIIINAEPGDVLRYLERRSLS